jgi:hypothetical protein
MASIDYAFFCEDIREEKGGKLAALGIPGRQLRIEQPAPGLLRSLAFLAYVSNPEHQAYPFRLVIDGPGLPPNFVKVEGRLDFSGPEVSGHHLNVTIPGVIPVSVAGDFVAVLTIESDPPVTARVVLQVTFAER